MNIKTTPTHVQATPVNQSKLEKLGTLKLDVAGGKNLKIINPEELDTSVALALPGTGSTGYIVQEGSKGLSLKATVNCSNSNATLLDGAITPSVGYIVIECVHNIANEYNVTYEFHNSTGYFGSYRHLIPEIPVKLMFLCNHLLVLRESEIEVYEIAITPGFSCTPLPSISKNSIGYIGAYDSRQTKSVRIAWDGDTVYIIEPQKLGAFSVFEADISTGTPILKRSYPELGSPNYYKLTSVAGFMLLLDEKAGSGLHIWLKMTIPLKRCTILSCFLHTRTSGYRRLNIQRFIYITETLLTVIC